MENSGEAKFDVREFFEKHRKNFMIVGAVIVGLLMSFYLYQFFRPGRWYYGTFIYKKGDTFEGTGDGVKYSITVKHSDDNNSADVIFTIDGVQKNYHIDGINHLRNVRIYVDGNLRFQGRVEHNDGGYMFFSDSSDDEYINVVENGTVASWPDENKTNVSDNDIVASGTEEHNVKFPSDSWIFSLASGKYTIRGNVYMLAILIFVLAILAIDIVFPKFFFLIEYGFAVNDPEPSEFYLVGQKIARVLMGVACVVLVFLSLSDYLR